MHTWAISLSCCCSSTFDSDSCVSLSKSEATRWSSSLISSLWPGQLAHCSKAHRSERKGLLASIRTNSWTACSLDRERALRRTWAASSEVRTLLSSRKGAMRSKSRWANSDGSIAFSRLYIVITMSSALALALYFSLTALYDAWFSPIFRLAWQLIILLYPTVNDCIYRAYWPSSLDPIGCQVSASEA